LRRAIDVGGRARGDRSDHLPVGGVNDIATLSARRFVPLASDKQFPIIGSLTHDTFLAFPVRNIKAPAIFRRGFLALPQS
jgi:hypothetical protein